MNSYKAAIEVEPKSFFPNYNMGVMLFPDRERRQEALQYYKTALEHARKAGERLYQMNALLSIALLQEDSHNYAEACETLRAAAKLDPENRKIE